MKDFIKNLQDKPYETRLKIMWGTVLFAGILLIAVFIWNIKAVVQNTSGTDLLNPPVDDSAEQTNLNLLSVEKVETRSGRFRIYFNLNNPGEDILNMALIEDITLTINNVQHQPTEIIDRQGQPFVEKILSKTQNFGVLIFPTIIGAKGTLEFDQMYFEKSPDTLFSQKVELDFNKLKTDNPIRN